MIFFGLNASPTASAETLLDMIKNHTGCFNEVDLLDGNEHGFIELGGWLGDQGLALTFMGLGTSLGLWDLLTPKTMLGESVDNVTALEMAGSGLITIKSHA